MPSQSIMYNDFGGYIWTGPFSILLTIWCIRSRHLSNLLVTFFLDKIIGNSNSNSTLSRFFGQHCYHATSILLILRYVEGYSNQNFFTIKYYTDVCSSLFHLILSPFLVARSRWLEDLAGRPSPELGQKMWLPCKTCFLSTDPLQMLHRTNGSKMGWLQEVGHFTRVQCSTIQTISLIVYLCLSISWVFKCS